MNKSKGLFNASGSCGKLCTTSDPTSCAMIGPLLPTVCLLIGTWRQNRHKNPGTWIPILPTVDCLPVL